MSDEETDTEDSNTFLKRSLTWRSDKLNRLIQKLDKRYVDSRKRKENSKPLKNRKDGPLSERSQPACAPKWAIAEVLQDRYTSSCSSGSDDIPSLFPTAVTPDQYTPSTSPAAAVSDCPNELSDNESDSDMDSWIYQVTGLQKWN